MSSQIVLTDAAPKIIQPVNAPLLSPEEAAKGHNCILMEFDHQVLFTVSHGNKVLYPKGVHSVPREWSTHWFLLNSGAKPYNRPMAVTMTAVTPKAAKKK